MTDTRTIIPAAPGFLMRSNGGDDRPVIGWAVEDGEYDAKPITPEEAVGYTIVRDVQTPTPTPSPYAMDPKLAAQHQMIDRQLAARTQAGGTSPAPTGPLQLTFEIPFEGKTYERESNWHYIGDPSFTFALPPNTPSPKSSLVQKTNREEAARLKREGVPQYDYTAVRNAHVVALGPTPAIEPTDRTVAESEDVRVMAGGEAEEDYVLSQALLMSTPPEDEGEDDDGFDPNLV